MMDQLERFLLVASGDELAGTLNSKEAHVSFITHFTLISEVPTDVFLLRSCA